MKLSEVKSVGKKIILLVFCVVLLLIFTSLSYGWGPDPKYDRLRGHPWERMLCPPSYEKPIAEIMLIRVTPHFILVLEVQKTLEKNNTILNQRDSKHFSKENLDGRKGK